MKQFFQAAALTFGSMTLGALLACSPLPVVSTSTSPAAASASSAAASVPSTSSQIGVALSEVTVARQAFTALAQAGKISWAQDDAAEAALTVIRNNLTSAQDVFPTDPAQAAALLATALQALAVYQGVQK